jgi:GTP-binding protein HflX
LRCIHTHLRNEGLDRDDVTDLALLRLDAMVAITMDAAGLPDRAHLAHLRPVFDGESPVEFLKADAPANLDFDFRSWIRDIEDELGRGDRARKIAGSEGAILVSVSAGRASSDLEMQVEELKELARSAGVEVIDVLTQHRPRVDPRFLIGPGKLQELVIRAMQADVDLVIFDQNLTPTQARNLSQRLDLRVIDRTQLILDLFAQHATSRDGKPPRPASRRFSVAAGGWHRRPRPGRDEARSRPPESSRSRGATEARTVEVVQPETRTAQSTLWARSSRALDRRLHECRQEHIDSRADPY